MNKHEIRQRLLGILQELQPQVNIENIHDHLLLKEDLGIDSISLLLLALKVEKQFLIVFDNLQPQDIQTVGDVMGYVTDKLLA